MKTRKPRTFFSDFFSSDFSILTQYSKSKNRKKKTRKKNSEGSMVCDASEFSIYHFLDFLIKCLSLSFSSDRFSFFKLRVFFRFLFLLCLNLLFQAIVGCDYPTCKYMFKVTQIKRNVYNICLKFKKLTKMMSVTANRV